VALFQAETVRQAVWEGEWVGAPLQQQRALMFMMAAANQQFTLTAGGFVSVSRHTMVTVRHTGAADTRLSATLRARDDVGNKCFKAGHDV
jgi:hypothetical protein